MSESLTREQQCIYRSGCKFPAECAVEKRCTGTIAEATNAADLRTCTCHPDDRPPVCQRRYGARECQDAYRAWKELHPAAPVPLASNQRVTDDDLEYMLKYWRSCKDHIVELSDTTTAERTMAGNFLSVLVELKQRRAGGDAEQLRQELREVTERHQAAWDLKNKQVDDLEQQLRSAHETRAPLGQEPWRLSLPVITVQMLGDYGQEGFFEKTDQPVHGVKGVSWSQAAVDFACMLQGRLQELLSAEYCRGRDDQARAAEVQRNPTGFPVKAPAHRCWVCGDPAIRTIEGGAGLCGKHSAQNGPADSGKP